jgi:hypothetical protein
LKAGNFISLFLKKNIVNVAGPFSFPIRVIHKVLQIRGKNRQFQHNRPSNAELKMKILSFIQSFLFVERIHCCYIYFHYSYLYNHHNYS